MTDIAKEYLRIEKNLDKWYKRLDNLKESCTHPNVEMIHCGNTGNYDPLDDLSWKDYHCPDCRKHWIVDNE